MELQCADSLQEQGAADRSSPWAGVQQCHSGPLGLQQIDPTSKCSRDLIGLTSCQALTLCDFGRIALTLRLWTTNPRGSEFKQVLGVVVETWPAVSDRTDSLQNRGLWHPLGHTGATQSYGQAGPAAQEPWGHQPDLGPAVAWTPPGTSRDVRHVSDRWTVPQQKGRHPGRRDPDRTPAQVSQSQGEREGERGEREVGVKFVPWCRLMRGACWVVDARLIGTVRRSAVQCWHRIARKTLLAGNVFVIPEAGATEQCAVQWVRNRSFIIDLFIRLCVCVLLTALVCVSGSVETTDTKKRVEVNKGVSAFEEPTRRTEVKRKTHEKKKKKKVQSKG